MKTKTPQNINATVAPSSRTQSRYSVSVLYKKREKAKEDLPADELLSEIVSAFSDNEAFGIVYNNNSTVLKNYELVKYLVVPIPPEERPEVVYNEYKKMRKEHNLILKDVQIATGVSSAHLSQLENQKIKRPNPDTVKKLDDFFNGLAINKQKQKA